LEIPEIADGLIVIKNVKRIPGEKAKVSVESYDERIDPVGACVGMKGSRIHSIVRELGNENIDVINYTENLKLFISRSLSPAKITSIQIDDDNKKADVYLKPDQVSLAIGKGGYNIRLAGQLTGYEIDVYRDIDEDEDGALTEFVDEIDEWIIDVFKSIGCDTAKSVLELGVEELSRRTDLEEETIKEVQNILRLEFEE
jgi:N utilization substance protein A